MILSSSTTQGQGEREINGNEELLHIPQSCNITEASLSDCLVSYLDTRWWAGVLLLCRDAVGVFFRASRLGYWKLE